MKQKRRERCDLNIRGPVLGTQRRYIPYMEDIFLRSKSLPLWCGHGDQRKEP